MESSAGLVVDSEGDIFSSGRGGLFSILGMPLAELPFEDNGSPTQFATALAFDAGSQPFEPHAGPDAGRLALMADFGFGQVDTFVTLIEPALMDDADFNNDMAIDAGDLAVWETNFGEAGEATRDQGDANGDQDVDGHDFLIWQRQYNPVGSPFQTHIFQPNIVPEPASLVLILVGVGASTLSCFGRLRSRFAI